MQRGLIKLSALAVAMGLAAAAHADVTVPSMKGGFNVAAEVDYLKPYGVDNQYGSYTDSQGNTQYLQNDAKFKFGYGVSVGYTLPNSANDIELSYNRYDSKEQGNSFVSEELGFAHGTEFRLKQDRFDLTLGQFVNVGTNLQLKLKGGLSYAKLGYDETTGEADAVTDQYSFEKSKAKFKGVGPTLGLDGTYSFGNTGFGVVAGISTSLLVGKSDYAAGKLKGEISELKDIDLDTDIPMNDQPSKSNVITAVDAKLGLTYERSVNDAYKLGAEAGYKATNYSLGNIDSASNLTIAGPYLRLKLAAC